MSIEQVKALRDRTHVSLNECRLALAEANGNIEDAIIVLQKRGTLRVGAMAGRATSQGQIFTYSHNGGIVGVVEVNCETDFAAKSPTFTAFGELLAMQVVGMNPTYLRREDIPIDLYARQMLIFGEQSKTVGTPEDRLRKIVDGKMAKWVSDVCLMEQEAVNVLGRKTIEVLRTETAASLGENVIVRRFVRWQMGQ